MLVIRIWFGQLFVAKLQIETVEALPLDERSHFPLQTRMGAHGPLNFIQKQAIEASSNGSTRETAHWFGMSPDVFARETSSTPCLNSVGRE